MASTKHTSLRSHDRLLKTRQNCPCMVLAPCEQGHNTTSHVNVSNTPQQHDALRDDMSNHACKVRRLSTLCACCRWHVWWSLCQHLPGRVPCAHRPNPVSHRESLSLHVLLGSSWRRSHHCHNRCGTLQHRNCFLLSV